MKIAVTDTGGSGSHENLVAPRPSHVDVFDLESAGRLVKNSCTHK
jgi:hypothetical protein